MFFFISFLFRCVFGFLLFLYEIFFLLITWYIVDSGLYIKLINVLFYYEWIIVLIIYLLLVVHLQNYKLYIYEGFYSISYLPYSLSLCSSPSFPSVFWKIISVFFSHYIVFFLLYFLVIFKKIMSQADFFILLIHFSFSYNISLFYLGPFLLFLCPK